MSFRVLFFVLLWSQCAVSLHSISIAIAPLIIGSDSAFDSTSFSGYDESRKFRNYLLDLDQQDTLKAKLHRNPEGLAGGVSTILDAAYFCQYYAAEFLIYGRIRYTEEYADIVLKLYDPGRQELIGTFYGKDAATELERLLEDSAKKVYVYLSETLGLAPLWIKREVERSLWDFQGRLGWWTTAGKWRQSLAGIASMEAGAYFTPIYPLWERRSWQLGGRFGFSFEYQLGMNTHGDESFTFHGLGFFFPVEAVFDYREEHRFAASVFPLLQVDILNQDRKYSATWTGVSVSGGLGSTLSYRFQLDVKHAIGFATGWRLIFYRPLRSHFPVSLFYEYSLR